jgi:RNA polymerase sigma-70 factor (ECF subfamily)
MNSTDQRRCAECGSDLPLNVPPGLCPRCALSSALATAAAETSAMPAPEAGERTPDENFEQRWAHSLLQAAIRRLEADYAARGQQALFDYLKELQPGKHGEKSYAQIGASLGMTEQAVKNAVLKFRRRYSDQLRDEIAQTVANPGEVEAELRHIMKVLAR